jgi:uncharacterized protein (DUF362 family)
MITRRTFLQSASSAALLLYARKGRAASKMDATCFSVHPFVENHPDAVFVLRTSITQKTDSADIWTAGLGLGRSLFGLSDPGPGAVPLDSEIAIKPNITCRDSSDSRYTTLGTMGIVTDSNFVGGLIDSLKELGVAGSRISIREVNCSSEFAEGGYPQMCERTGAQIGDFSNPVGVLPEDSIIWKDVPEGVWFNRIPYLRPVNTPGSWLLNVAKFKTHAMGLTLCAKNIQGTIVHNYQAHCTALGDAWPIRPADIRAGAEETIRAMYARHCAAGIPRWDRPEANGGLWMEAWAARCLDNNSVTVPGLHIVEGIYGRDGHFIDGPGPGGLATDYMTNIIIFGKNQFHVDNIGHWLAGHEPGNFGLFHLAIERKLATILNPSGIPLYEWKSDGSAAKIDLGSLTRTPLKTGYLRRDYNGQQEDQWHLVNEPYLYGTDAVSIQPSRPPEATVLAQNYPNPFNGTTSIQYSIPEGGNVSLQIFDAQGALVDRLEGGYRMAGTHLARWTSNERPSGIYFCRLVYKGYTAVTRMILIR